MRSPPRTDILTSKASIPTFGIRPGQSSKSLRLFTKHWHGNTRIRPDTRIIITALFGPHTHHAFIIYHPALTYLARYYGLQQIALENEGKEPSAEHMRRIIDTARNLNLTKLFYQRQFSKSTVDALARELNIPAVPIDPLAPDVINNTLEISKLIAQP